MAVERADARATPLDVLDRVLDKGIVIDAWVRVSLVGIDLLTVEARVIIASIETYILHSDALGWVARRCPAQPQPEGRSIGLRSDGPGTALPRLLTASGHGLISTAGARRR